MKTRQLFYYYILIIFFISLIYSKKRTHEPINIAFCLTGQLARLELLSKIKNIFLINAKLGHQVHVFIYLDNEIEEIKQTFWKYDYSSTPFINYNKEQLESYIIDKIQTFAMESHIVENFKVFVRLEPPIQDKYQIVGDFIPVSDKTIHKPKKDMKDLMPEGGVEPAAVRFQNNMRWLGGLRECVKWMQQEEFEQKLFYDLVVRLRDDTLAFGPWKLSYEKHRNKLSSLRTGSYRGVNDHNFIIDRKYADIMFRGFTEDYYFNKSQANVAWGNPEHRIYQLAEAYHVNIRNESICEQPLISLRGKVNNTHWMLHSVYADNFLKECQDGKLLKADRCKCDPKWIKLFIDKTVSVIDV